MRLIIYIFLISQLLNFLGVFAEKVNKNISRFNKVNWEKVEENKSNPLKRLSGNTTRVMKIILKIKINKAQQLIRKILSLKKESLNHQKFQFFLLLKLNLFYHSIISLTMTLYKPQ